MAQKYVLLRFQASSKPWEAGCFTLNVNISSKPAVVVRSVSFGTEQYRRFEDGYYRLTVAAGEKDSWWCLQRREDRLSRTSNLVDYWEPTTYDSQEAVISECLRSVNAAFERTLLYPLGYLSSEGTAT